MKEDLQKGLGIGRAGGVKSKSKLDPDAFFTMIDGRFEKFPEH